MTKNKQLNIPAPSRKGSSRWDKGRRNTLARVEDAKSVSLVSLRRYMKAPVELHPNFGYVEIEDLKQNDLVYLHGTVYIVNLQFEPRSTRIFGKKLVELKRLVSDLDFGKTLYEKALRYNSMRFATDKEIEADLNWAMSKVDLLNDLYVEESEDRIYLNRKNSDDEMLGMSLEEAKELRKYLNKRLG